MDMIEISAEFCRKALAQIFRTDCLFLRQDELLILQLIRGLEALTQEEPRRK